jgi:hypothetical protein
VGTSGGVNGPGTFGPAPGTGSNGTNWGTIWGAVGALGTIVGLIVTFALVNSGGDSGNSGAGAPQAAASVTAVRASETSSPSPGASRSVTNTQATSRAVWTVRYQSRPVTLPQAQTGCDAGGLDLDGPKSGTYGTLGFTSVVDLKQSARCGSGTLPTVEVYEAKSWGPSSTAQPTPDQCFADSQGAMKLRPAQVKVGDSYCLVTDKELLVWLTVTDKGAPNTQETSELTFSATSWQRTQ